MIFLEPALNRVELTLTRWEETHFPNRERAGEIFTQPPTGRCTDADVAVARSEVTLSSPLTSMQDFSHPYAMTGEVTLYLLLIASDERSEPCVFERETRSPIEDDDDSDTGKKIRDTTFEDFSVPYGTAEMRVVYSSET